MTEQLYVYKIDNTIHLEEASLFVICLGHIFAVYALNQVFL